MSQLGDYLRYARRAARLTQREMADRVGVHIITYADYENGRIEPSLPVAWKISRILGVSVEDMARIAAENSEALA